MSGLLLDTHAALWHLWDSPEMPATVTRLVEEVTGRGEPLFVSAVSVIEVLYLVEKGRLPETAFDQLAATLSDPDSDLFSVPFNMDVALNARGIPRKQVPDMPDRIIAATALYLGVPLITRDRRIQAANIETIW